MKDLTDFRLTFKVSVFQPTYISLVEVGRFVEYRRHISFLYDVVECSFFDGSVVWITITK